MLGQRWRNTSRGGSDRHKLGHRRRQWGVDSAVTWGIGEFGWPTVANTRPLKPISEGKVHGSTMGSEQAAGPQAPQLELALDAPIRPWRNERLGRLREARRRQWISTDNHHFLGKWLLWSHKPLCTEETGQTWWKRKRPANRWKSSKPPLHRQIARYK